MNLDGIADPCRREGVDSEAAWLPRLCVSVPWMLTERKPPAAVRKHELARTERRSGRPVCTEPGASGGP